MKKILLIAILAIFLMSFSGCGRKQKGITPDDLNHQPQTKIVKIDSYPEGATVFIDDDHIVETPSDVKLALGKHNIVFEKDGYQGYILENAVVKKDTTEIKVVLKKIDEASIIKLTKVKLSDALLSTPSKFVFISGKDIYISNENGKTIQKVAVTGSNYRTQIIGASPSSKWVILNISPEDVRISSEQLLYALNVETPELIKIASGYWEGGFSTSFESGSDRLVYGFHGVNAPFCYIASFNFATRKTSYLLDCSENSVEKAFSYDISPDGKYIAYAGGNVEIYPDNRTALYLKNLKTGKLKMLVKPSNLDRNKGDDFISHVNFANGGKEIIYSREIWQSGSDNPVVKYFITDLEGHIKEISLEDTSKFSKKNRQIMGEELSKKLNKNAYIYAVLDTCGKIVFETHSKEVAEELYICNTDFSAVQDTGISNPNFMNFSHSCKFTCEVPINPQTSVGPYMWYLIDAKNNTKVNLNELFKMNVTDAIYIEKH